MGENAAILTEWYERVWQNGEAEAIDTLMKPDTLAGGLVPGMQIGPDEFKLLVATLDELIEAPKVRMEKLIEVGDWVSAFITFQATPRDGSPSFDCSAMTFARIKGGKIVEAYNTLDFVMFFESLGLLPPDTVALLLSGQALQ